MGKERGGDGRQGKGAAVHATPVDATETGAMNLLQSERDFLPVDFRDHCRMPFESSTECPLGLGAGDVIDIDPETRADREVLVVGREFERVDGVRALPKGLLCHKKHVP